MKLLSVFLVSNFLEFALSFRLTTLDKELLMNRINEIKADDILKILNINVHSNGTFVDDHNNSTLLNSSLDKEEMNLSEEDVLKNNRKYNYLVYQQYRKKI